MSYRQAFGPVASARPLAQAVAVALALAYGADASAAIITVDVTTDTTNPGQCSLRDAINASRTNAAVNGCAAGELASVDTITFALALPASLALGSTLPALQDGVNPQALVVQGPGAANLEIVISTPVSMIQSFQVNPGPLTIEGLTLRTTVNAGAAVLYRGGLTVRNAAITGPFSSGAQSFPPGGFLIEDSVFTGTNTGVLMGGGTMTVRGSTFTGNALGVAANSGFGTDGTATIENSTFDANTGVGVTAADVRAFGYGGTLTLNLRNTTLTGNTASRRVVLETSFNGGTVNAAVDSSLFSGPAGSTDIDVLIGGPGGTTTLTANNSLFSEAQAGIPESVAGTGNQFAVANPGLDVLANNGGPTQTRALQVGSPAINTGSNPATLAFDQRGTGFPRTRGATTDVGAFEFTAPQNVQVFDPSNTVQIADGDVTPAVADGTDFGATPVGTPVARTYTIRNTGDVALAIAGINSSPGAFTVSNVPVSVAAGGTATFTVTYDAAAAGPASATITVQSEDPDPADATYTFDVAATAFTLQNVQVFNPGNTIQIVDGDATPSAADGTDFGATPVGTPVARTYTIRNTGGAALSITGINSSPGAFTVSNVPVSVAAGGTATFTVTYNAAVVGPASATITVASNDPDLADASYTFDVAASAFVVQNVQVFNPGNTIQIVDGDATPSAADGTDFGTTIVGTPVARTYTIRNTGTQPLTINGVTSGSAAFAVTGVPASVPGGGSATFTVTLGAAAVGPASGTITVSSNDPDLADASYTFAVQGTVAGPRDIDVFDATGVTPIADGDAMPSVAEGTDFGTVPVGTPVARSFTIRNSGGEPLAVNGIVSSNPAFVLGNVPASVPAGGSTTFTVTFSSNVPVTASGTITITTNDPDASESQWTFAVQGAAGAVAVAPTVIPSLSGWAMTLLAAVLAALGWRRRDALRVRPRA